MSTQPRLQQTFSDNNADGIADASLTEIYDTSGNLILEASDTNGDGRANVTTTYTYDDSGNRSAKYVDYADRGAFGSLEYALTLVYSYDAAGNLTITYTDGEINQSLRRVYAYTFNTNGDPLRSANGPVGGELVVTQDYRYSESGQLILFQDIQGGRTTEYTYDDAGHPASIVVTYLGSNVREVTTNTYDNAGRLAAVTFENSYGYSRVTTNTYNDAGKLATATARDNNGNVTTSTYDAAGNIIEQIYPYGRSAFSYDYDAAGNILRKASDFNGDGRFDTIEFYAYDAAGNQTYQAFDRDGDGDLEQIITRRFSDEVPGLVAVDGAIATDNDIFLVGNVIDNANLLTHPLIKVTQVNGLPASVGTQLTLASGALLQIAANGQFIYNPNGKFDSLTPGSTATDSFTYTLVNSDGATDTATVNITINDAVVITTSGLTSEPTSEPLVRQVLNDSNGDGIPESVVTYTYDAFGNRTGQLSDNNNDGIPDFIYQATYDSANNKLSESFDDNGDGIANRTATYTYDENNTLRSEIRVEDVNWDSVADTAVLTYDAQGNLILETLDRDANGIADRFYTYRYDVAGNRIRETFDYDGDGIVDGINTFAYDAFGYRTLSSFDNNGDGLPEYASTAAYTYDAAGNQTSSVNDYNADGITDSTLTSTYDALGNLTSRADDEDGDGTLDSLYTYTYDAANNRTGETVDYNGDGILDSLYRDAYDAAGHPTLRSSDYDGDGIADNIYTYTYDVAGRLASESVDNNGDGNLDSLSIYVAGRLMSLSNDYDSDGIFDSINSNTDTYDAVGNLTSVFSGRSGDGTLFYAYSYHYDAAGRWTKSSNDFNGDGILDSVNSFTYDAKGDRIREASDTNADGIPESIFGYTYDTQGNRTSVSIDSNGDGKPERIDTTLYAATVNAPNREAVVYEPLLQQKLVYRNRSSTPSTTNTYQYNLAGQEILQSVFSPGPTVEQVSTKVSTYDGAGNLIREEGPSVFGGISTYTYDAAGNQTSVNRDFDSDGQIDLSMRYTYDAAGNRIEEATDVEGFNVSLSKYTYDEAGNQTSQSVDLPGEGVNFGVIFSATYNANGHEITSARDFNLDGRFDYFTQSTYSFDGEGNLTRSIFVDSLVDGVLGEGTFDSIYTYTFNTSGQQTKATLDEGAEGTLDTVVLYAYDTYGNLVNTSANIGPEGTFNAIKQTVYTYDSAGNKTSGRVILQGGVTPDLRSKFVLPSVVALPEEIFGVRAVGTSDDDSIVGTANNDILLGEMGVDTLDGLSGDDTLFGGQGNDSLTGGQGQDTFVLAAAAGTDTLTDFAANDLIGLAGGIGFGDLSFLGNDILLASSNEVLAKLPGVDTTTLQSAQFVAV